MSDQSLRELFEQLARDPSMRAEYEADKAGFLDVHGHGELDGPLVAEALTNVAAGLPPDVAAHLSPLTVSASPLPDTSGEDTDVDAALDLLASTPAWPEPDTDGQPAPEGSEVVEEALDGFGSGAGDVDVETAGDLLAELDMELAESATVAEPDVVGPEPTVDLTVDEPEPSSLLDNGDPTALDEETDGLDSDDFFDG